MGIIDLPFLGKAIIFHKKQIFKKNQSVTRPAAIMAMTAAILDDSIDEGIVHTMRD